VGRVTRENRAGRVAVSDSLDVSATQAIVALWSGEPDGLVASLAEDVAWWEIGLAEAICGRAEVALHLHRTTDVDVSADVHDVLANEEHIVTLIHASATRSGRAFDYSFAEVYHVNERGQITKRQAFAPDTRPIVEFFG
jgi:ketosteroid isomerase-like protein